jgi:hypothetical protein
MAGRASASCHRGRFATSTQPIRQLLQHRPATPGAESANSAAGLPGPSQGGPDRPGHPRPLPSPTGQNQPLGCCHVRYNSRLHHIGLGARLAGTPVSLLIDDRHIRVIHRHAGQLIRELILNPATTTNPAAYHQGQPRALPPAHRPLPPIAAHPQRPQLRSTLAAGHPQRASALTAAMTMPPVTNRGHTLPRNDLQPAAQKMQRCPKTPSNGVPRHHMAHPEGFEPPTF